MIQNVVSEIKQTLIYMFAWGVFISINVWAGGHVAWLLGFLLGWVSSIIYYLLMANRVKKCLDVPPAKAVSYMRMGWYIRLCFVLMVLIISVKLPQVNFWAAVAGMFSYQFVLFISAIFFVLTGTLNQHLKKYRDRKG